MSKPLQKFVNRLTTRSALSSEAIAGLLALDPVKTTHQARWDLVRPGQTVDFACLVDSGLVGRWEQFSDGSRRIAAIYIAGDMCDLHSVPEPKASWGITPLNRADIYQVPHDDLRRLFVKHADLAMAFWRDTIADASILAKLATTLSGLPARERVAHIICEFAIRSEVAGVLTGDTLTVPMTQSHFADLAGVSVVHMSRILRSLAEDGAIQTERGEIRVIDRALIERIADFDPRYLLLSRAPKQMLSR
jgi:CRP-like cAMP-binding protein